VELIELSNEGRLKKLVPVRHDRMRQSPLAFYRGAAIIMTADLATTAVTGVRVQACGDCHLQNFGWFATPERNLAFDITDFDESLPAPWEWDVKRLVTSFAIAAAELQIPASADECREAAVTAARSYRKRLAEFMEMPTLLTWQFRIDASLLIERATTPTDRKAYEQLVKKARQQSGEQLLAKLTERTKSGLRFRDKGLQVFHAPQRHKHQEIVREFLHRYSENLQEDRRILFQRFQLVDAAFKVVGVGSVGLRCEIALLLDADEAPLILQLKEAKRSVLEPFAGASHHEHQSHRIVHGQRLIQSASDLFLGWGWGKDGRDYYVRQLRDMKISIDAQKMSYAELLNHARLCGWALARSHAKSGTAAEISGYLGQSDKFDQSVADFAFRYAVQNLSDFAAFKKAIKSGRLAVSKEK
jgi:uncharacterized protein (DUF2252 family)